VVLFVPAHATDEAYNPKAVIFVSPTGFQDDEFSALITVFDKESIDYTIVSSTLETAIGMKGLEIKPDMLIDDLEVSDYSGLVFVGGEGMEQYAKNELVLDAVRDAFRQKKIIAAICISPVILVEAGILKKATVTCSRFGEELVKSKGATILSKSVVVSGNIITGMGPKSSFPFAKTVAVALKNKK